MDAVPYALGNQSSSGFALMLLLSDGTTLHVCRSLDDPTDDDEDDDEIADWEVFTPYERCITVGPGLHWAYIDTRAVPSS